MKNAEFFLNLEFLLVLTTKSFRSTQTYRSALGNRPTPLLKRIHLKVPAMFGSYKVQTNKKANSFLR